MPFFNPRAYLDRPTLRTTRGIIQQQRIAAQRTEQERKNLLEEQEADAESFDELVRQDRARLYQLGGQLQRQEMQELGEFAQEKMQQRTNVARTQIRERELSRRQAMEIAQEQQKRAGLRQLAEQMNIPYVPDSATMRSLIKMRRQQQKAQTQEARGQIQRRTLFADIARDRTLPDDQKRDLMRRLRSPGTDPETIQGRYLDRKNEYLQQQQESPREDYKFWNKRVQQLDERIKTLQERKRAVADEERRTQIQNRLARLEQERRQVARKANQAGQQMGIKTPPLSTGPQQEAEQGAETTAPQPRQPQGPETSGMITGVGTPGYTGGGRMPGRPSAEQETTAATPEDDQFAGYQLAEQNEIRQVARAVKNQSPGATRQEVMRMVEFRLNQQTPPKTMIEAKTQNGST